MQINRLSIDSTHSNTDLCKLAVKYPTDKCPYHNHPHLHRHAYTSIYNLLFSHLRYKEITIGEVGILDNHSMLCWREYFPNATLFGYEYHDDKLQKGIRDNLNNATYTHVDVTSEQSLNNVFNKNNFFDIIIEDSTHVFEDQIRFLNIAYKCIKPGGIIIIEDIFLREDENRYMEAMDHIKEYFSSAIFIMANHELKFSPGWDNDKLLVLHRNDKPCF